jgi:cytochrome c peroxidase
MKSGSRWPNGLIGAIVTGVLICISDSPKLIGVIGQPDISGLPRREWNGPAGPSAAVLRLGRKLFFDPVLSANNHVACATCHVPRNAFTFSGDTIVVGTQTVRLARNPPTLLNVVFQQRLFVDGRSDTLEAQFLHPLVSRNEMGNRSAADVVEELKQIPLYIRLFREAFSEKPSVERLAEAVAAFERTLIAGGSPFDRWYYGGQVGAMSPLARAGFDLFVGRAGCVNCHTVRPDGSLFTDHQYHNTGVAFAKLATDRRVRELFAEFGRGHPGGEAAILEYLEQRGLDLGRQQVTGKLADVGRFKTPSLRNVALTPPYMHDGSLATLREVVHHYNKGGAANPWLDPRVWRLSLSAPQIDALVSFLEALSSPAAHSLAEVMTHDLQR